MDQRAGMTPELTGAPAELSPDELAAAARAGRGECFDELVRRLRPRLRSFLLTRAHADDVDDLVQETLLRAYDNLDRYDPDRSFSTWLFTIAKRLAVSHHRAQRPASALGAVVSPAEPPDVAVSRVEDGRRLWAQAHAALGEREYRALWLRYAEERSVREIADELGITAIHVKVVLYRARRRLAAEMK
ncbi:RNA polymerase sigma factor [Haliangium sp.]|uniref:RNA polymerase sigma factor n=1 Tax=Haliangium sp. TaxID=2663208 RepID=UPI003D149588